MSRWRSWPVLAAVLGICLCGATVRAQEGCPGAQQSFYHTGGTSTYVVPSGASELTITAIGGGGGGSSGAGGGGGSYYHPLGTIIAAGAEFSSNDGLVMILLPVVFADDFESGSAGRWSAQVPAP